MMVEFGESTARRLNFPSLAAHRLLAMLLE
jgi:hypothetical protein